MTHTEMYTELCALTRREKSLDASYHAAFYLLSADGDLFEKALPYVNGEGIDFVKLKQACRGMDETRRYVINVAHNLFSWTSRCTVTPFDISHLGYPLLDYVCNALYIANGSVSIKSDANDVGGAALVLDSTRYDLNRRVHSEIQSMTARLIARD